VEYGTCGTNVDIVQTVVVTLAAIPYIAEILWQLPLLARVMRALPPDTRAALPPHPRRPWLAAFGSARFFLALFRFALRDTPSDEPVVRALKRRMRASAVREAVFGVVFWGTAILCWCQGWRPWS
jgi:hypothetical protein